MLESTSVGSAWAILLSVGSVITLNPVAPKGAFVGKFFFNDMFSGNDRSVVQVQFIDYVFNILKFDTGRTQEPSLMFSPLPQIIMHVLTR